MKTKKATAILILIALAILAIVIAFLAHLGFFEKENPSILEGTVVEVGDAFVLVQDDFDENGVYIVGTSDVSQIYVNGTRTDKRKIQVGQHIVVSYTGGILETNPGQVQKVIEIRAGNAQ